MNVKKAIVPSVLLFIGIANLTFLVLFPQLEFDILLLMFFVLFTLLAIGTYKGGNQTFVKKGTLSELLPYIDFHLPPSNHLEELRVKKEIGHVEISGTFMVDSEDVKLQLLHIKEEHLPPTANSTKTSQELLYQTIKEKDRQTLNIQNIDEDPQFKISGDIITAYIGNISTDKDSHLVLRGVANLEGKGLLMISIAARSPTGLQKAKEYLTNLSSKSSTEASSNC